MYICVCLCMYAFIILLCTYWYIDTLILMCGCMKKEGEGEGEREGERRGERGGERER